MWPFFTLMKAGPDGFGWLTEDVKDQYREVWNAGPDRRLQPLPRYADEAGRCPAKRRANFRRCRANGCAVEVPTFVLWALDDAALLPGLLEGLEDYVPRSRSRRCRCHALGGARAAAVSWRSEIEALPAALSVDRSASPSGRVLKRRCTQ